jgi:hypothetical protein
MKEYSVHRVTCCTAATVIRVIMPRGGKTGQALRGDDLGHLDVVGIIILKRILSEIRYAYKCVEKIHLAQVRDQWRAFVNKVMNLLTGNFLTS